MSNGITSTFATFRDEKYGVIFDEEGKRTLNFLEKAEKNSESLKAPVLIFAISTIVLLGGILLIVSPRFFPDVNASIKIPGYIVTTATPVVGGLSYSFLKFYRSHSLKEAKHEFELSVKKSVNKYVKDHKSALGETMTVGILAQEEKVEKGQGRYFLTFGADSRGFYCWRPNRPCYILSKFKRCSIVHRRTGEGS